MFFLFLLSAGDVPYHLKQCRLLAPQVWAYRGVRAFSQDDKTALMADIKIQRHHIVGTLLYIRESGQTAQVPGIHLMCKEVEKPVDEFSTKRDLQSCLNALYTTHESLEKFYKQRK